MNSHARHPSGHAGRSVRRPIHDERLCLLVSGGPDGDTFAGCAVTAGATVVTEDRHVDALRSVDVLPVRVVGSEGFRERLAVAEA